VPQAEVVFKLLLSLRLPMLQTTPAPASASRVAPRSHGASANAGDHSAHGGLVTSRCDAPVRTRAVWQRLKTSRYGHARRDRLVTITSRDRLSWFVRHHAIFA
jgi:hypothetical protein